MLHINPKGETVERTVWKDANGKRIGADKAKETPGAVEVTLADIKVNGTKTTLTGFETHLAKDSKLLGEMVVAPKSESESFITARMAENLAIIAQIRTVREAIINNPATAAKLAKRAEELGHEVKMAVPTVKTKAADKPKLDLAV